MGRRSSRTAAAVNAVRRHRRRMAKKTRAKDKDTVVEKPSIRAATAVAIREANPRTNRGLAAQLATVGAMNTTAAAWRHRVALAPVAATAVVVPAAALLPAPTATGLVVTGLAGLVASRADHPLRRRRLGLAWWSGGLLTWMGAGAVGATTGLVWWQDMLALVAAVAPGAIAWWRPPPPREFILPPEPPAELEWIPPAALLLGRVLEEVARMERSPILGARVERVACPAEGVAVAVVGLPGGMHADEIDVPRLRRGLEALLDRAGAGQLGHLRRGAVQIQPADEALGVTRLQITASWSRELDTDLLAWRPPADLASGQAWLGVDDARESLVVPMWEVGADGKWSVIHAWLIGRTGGGKSTTLRTLLAPGVVSGCQLLILVDGKGDSLSELAPYAVGRAVARDAESWRQAITLAYAIMTARRKRLGTPQAWRGPTPTDPVVTLIIDECTTVLAGLTKREVRMVCEIARMGRSVGVGSIQAGQIPLVETVIGESEWRSQARLVLGHGVLDAVHNRLATQSGGPAGPSLLGLPNGRLVALLDGQVLAHRGRVSLLAEDELTAAAAGSPRADLCEADRSVHVCRLLDLAQDWAASSPDSIVDMDDLLAEWEPDETPARTGSDGPTEVPAAQGDTSGTPGAGRTAPVPGQGRPAAGRGGRGEGGIRQLVLAQVLTHAGVTRKELVEHFGAQASGGYGRSAVYGAINELIDSGSITDQNSGLIATLWIHRAQRTTESESV